MRSADAARPERRSHPRRGGRLPPLRAVDPRALGTASARGRRRETRRRPPAAPGTEIPGNWFSPATTSSRRSRNSSTIAATQSCGPVSAAMPAAWTKPGTHETEFVISRVRGSTSGCGDRCVPTAPARHRIGLRQAVEQDGALEHPRHTGDRRGLLVVDDPSIDLVAQYPGRAFANELGGRAQVVGRNDAARRIVRRVDDHQLRSLAQPVAAVRRARNGSRAHRGAPTAPGLRPPSGSPTRRSGSQGLDR